MKHLPLLLRLQLTPLRRGRGGHPKKSLSQPQSLNPSPSPSLRRSQTGRRGRPSPSMATTRSLLLLSCFLLLSMFPPLSPSLNQQLFPLFLHLNPSLPLNPSLLQHLNRLPLPQSRLGLPKNSSVL